MSLSNLQDAKEQVRQAVDIVELVGGYIALRRQGRGYVGLCPWHDDSRPSLQVNPERQSWKCWVCDVGGDIFSFIMKAERLEFREALEFLAEKAGIQVAPTARSADSSESQFDRKNLLRACAWAEEQFYQCLLKSSEAEPARRYLADRGVTRDSIDRFRIGFAPNDWNWLLQRAAAVPYSPAALERVDLAAKRDSGGFYDRFRGRLMFSIRDVRSRPIAFGGRVLPEFAREDDAKYINSRETPLFNKSSQLYALDLARDGIASEQGVLVMEGYTDVIMAHQHGVTNAVAVLGTALGEKHVPLLRRFTDRVTLVLDGDAAGQRRTMDILDNLLALFVSQEIEFRILTLPSGADPCDVIRTHGCDQFRRLLDESTDALEHKLKSVTNGLAQTASAHRAAQAIEAVLATLARAIPAGPLASSTALLREQQVLSRLARQFGVAEDGLRTRLKALRSAAVAAPRRVRADAAETPAASVRRTPASSWERELVELLLYYADGVEPILEHVDPAELESPEVRELFERASHLYHSAGAVSFDGLMLAVNTEAAKSLLVDCDEAGRSKCESDPRRRLRDLLASLDHRRQESRHRATMAELKQNQLEPEQADQALVAMFADLKRRQTGAPLTDE